MRKLALFTIIAILLAFMAGTIYAAPPGEPPGLERAIAAQEKHNSQLLATQGVVGTAVGLTTKGKPVVKIFTEKAGVTGLPESLDGVPVKVQITGKIFALRSDKAPDKPEKDPKVEEPATTDIWQLPVPIGVSTGNENGCSAGTIAARVKDKNGNNVYALSNNHVYALGNSAPIDSQVLQPGLYDTRCILNGNNILGTLSDFEPLVFDGETPNEIDAAIALTDTGTLDNSTPESSGYGTPNSTTVSANDELLWKRVQKFGKTTKLTKGVVTGVHATVDVGYSSGTARFVNQIVVQSSRKPFIKSGDSGSLLVTNNPECNPVGLLFAGNTSGKLAIANPIDKVLEELGVTIDGK